MATQRYISTSFWDDPWIRKLTPDERYLYLYFLTSPLTNIAGVYQIAIDRIEYDSGFSQDKIREIIKAFEDAGKAFYYHETFMVIPKWPNHQKWHSHSKISAGIHACLKNMDAEILFFLKKIGYTYPIDSLLPSEDSLPIGYTYPRNYSDPNTDPDLDINTDTDLESHFIKLWQGNPQTFNFLSGLKRPKDWKAFWEKCTFSIDQIDTAVENFLAAVKSGAIERRFIPSSPDSFVLNGWLQKSLEPYHKPGQNKISNDQVQDLSIEEYFREG